jgi:CHAT domain-containing protein
LGYLLAPLPRTAEEREAVFTEERAAATELSRLLFPPELVDRLKTWKGVTFVGLDVLGPIALGWLPLGDEPYLGRIIAWDVLPSIPFGVAREALHRSAPNATTQELLLITDVVPASSLQREHPELVPLPLAPAVARSLERSYTSAHAIQGDYATPARVMAEVFDHRVVQFLVHAVHEPERARPTGLVLQPDGDDPGVLWADSIAERGFAAQAPDLIVLTACRSAQAPTRRGDAGSADLAGAWLAAGVPAVLVSHSDLTWGPTIEVTEAFHNHLRESACSTAEALRLALCDLGNEDSRELPFRYGLLEVVGLGHRPVFPEVDGQRGRRKTVSPLALFLVGLIAAVVWSSWRIRRTA